ncbi:hypothetical protein chiPu_0002282 [Chiloscyllium punctatum]|uniref:Uncharacterized protein n=1 Tax=Chiloscyllium punctatum TaxID=137246 RepID=A0A401S0F0_CHIPU|nr:hypothetical protein [Chiloscyllium punctatum]
MIDQGNGISCTATSIHRRDPTTDGHGGFDLLRFRPGPIHPSLPDLVIPDSSGDTISMPSLVRTPDRHSPQQPRTPGLKQSDSLSLRVAGLQARATTPGELQRYSIDTSTQRHKALRMM